MEFFNSNVDATIGVSSMDGRNLSSSKKMVLIFSTEIVNTDMELSEDYVTLNKLKTWSVLMRCAKLTHKSYNTDTVFKIYLLASDGTIRKPHGVLCANGKIHVDIYTSALPDGSTPFFELIAGKQ